MIWWIDAIERNAHKGTVGTTWWSGHWIHQQVLFMIEQDKISALSSILLDFSKYFFYSKFSGSDIVTFEIQDLLLKVATGLLWGLVNRLSKMLFLLWKIATYFIICKNKVQPCIGNNGKNVSN